MTDAELLRTTIKASGVIDGRTGRPSTRGTAALLDLDEGTARAVLRGDKALGRSTRVLCRLIIARPDLVEAIAGLSDGKT